MTDKTATQHNSTPVAVLHCTGAVVRGLIGTAGPRAAVTAWQEFPADDTDRISAWLNESGAESVLGVLPAASVVCRTCTLPDVAAEQLEQALALQAEAHLLTEMPAHRRARAVLPMAPGETSRSGIMVSWPETTADGNLPDALSGRTLPRLSFVPDVAALAALLNGQRSDGPLLFFDRHDGSVALVISHANGAIIRAARVGSESAGDIADAIGRVVAETALSVSHTPEFTEAIVAETTRRINDLDAPAGLVARVEIITAAAARLDGAPTDAAWWQQYGVAAGALLAAGGGLAPLTRLRLDAPIQSVSRARQLAAALSSPRRATAVVIVSVLVGLLGPLLVSGLKLGLLKLKLKDLPRYVDQAGRAEVQLAMYRELKDHAWPMTKLLADLACNTPEGIDVEQIRIRHGERVTVTGRAKKDSIRNLTAQQVVALMQDNLHATNIFDEIYLNWGDPNNFDAYEFTLTAKVANPYRAHAYPIELDYGRWTLRERMYREGGPPTDADATRRHPDTPAPSEPEAPAGDPAGQPDETPAGQPYGRPAGQPETQLAEVPETQPADRAAPQRTRTRIAGPPAGRAGGGGPAFRGSDRGAGGGGVPMSQDIPEPITPEEVDVMTLADAQEAYRHLSQALQQARVDEDTKKRLWDEWKLVRNRFRELKKNEERSP